jgi:hypothetical protein
MSSGLNKRIPVTGDDATGPINFGDPAERPARALAGRVIAPIATPKG